MRKNIINLKAAMDLIRETMSEEKKQNSESPPYFFVIGAGVSAPEIEDANALIEGLVLLTKKRGQADAGRFDQILAQTEKYSVETGELYSFWLQSAFKSKIECRQYLKELVRPARISAANLLLGQILCAKTLATSVLSSNFDDKLSQALELLGARDVFIADAPADCAGIAPSNDEIQLIYVRGSYHYYSFGKNNTQLRAASDEIQHMEDVLDTFYKCKTPIFIGYGGGEGDEIMTRLKEQLRHPLRYSVLWFCYNQKAYDTLPDWLTNNGNVIFVLPEKGTDCSSAADCFLGKAAQEDLLPASDVFSALISSFAIEPPELYFDRDAYYQRTLAQSLPEDEDIFYLKRWAKRMSRAEQDAGSDVERLIKKMENAAVSKSIHALSELTDVLKDTSFLSKEDFYHTLFKIICPLLNDRTGMSPDEDTLALCTSTLLYLEKMLHLLTQVEDAAKVLSAILSRLPVHNPAYAQRILPMCDQILFICRKSSALFDLEIKALHIRAELSSGAQRAALQDQIAGRCFLHKDNAGAAFAAITALYEMFVKSRSPEERKALLDNIEELSYIFPEDKRFQKRFYETKLRALTQSGSNPSRFVAYIEEMSGRDDPAFYSLILKAYQTQIKELTEPAEQLRLCKAALKYGEQPDADNCAGVLAFIDILSTMVYIFTGRQELGEAKKYCFEILTLQKMIPFCVFARRHAVFAMNLLAFTAADMGEKEKWYRGILSLCLSHTDNPELLAGLFSAIENLLKILPEDAQQKLIAENRPYLKYSRAQALCAQAVIDLLAGNTAVAEAQLLIAYDLYEALFGADYDNPAAKHLAYIKRKQHSDTIKIPLLTLLKEKSSNRGDAFRCINLALCYIEGNKVKPDWTQAVDVFNKIENDVPPALAWWKNASVVGEEESALVLLMLYLTNKAALSDIGLSDAAFKEQCEKITCLPQNFNQLFPVFDHLLVF